MNPKFINFSFPPIKLIWFIVIWNFINWFLIQHIWRQGQSLLILSKTAKTARYRPDDPGRFWAMKVLRRQIVLRREDTLLFCLSRENVPYVLLSPSPFIEMEFLLRRTDRTKLTVKLKLIPSQEKQWRGCWLCNKCSARTIFQLLSKQLAKRTLENVSKPQLILMENVQNSARCWLRIKKYSRLKLRLMEALTSPYLFLAFTL